jgi:hypothetical protein
MRAWMGAGPMGEAENDVPLLRTIRPLSGGGCQAEDGISQFCFEVPQGNLGNMSYARLVRHFGYETAARMSATAITATGPRVYWASDGTGCGSDGAILLHLRTVAQEAALAQRRDSGHDQSSCPGALLDRWWEESLASESQWGTRDTEDDGRQERMKRAEWSPSPGVEQG